MDCESHQNDEESQQRFHKFFQAREGTIASLMNPVNLALVVLFQGIENQSQEACSCRVRLFGRRA
jgi:hypothetical protein